MAFRYDRERGEWVYDDPTDPASTAVAERPVPTSFDTFGQDLAARDMRRLEAQQQAQFDQQQAEFNQAKPDLPFIADSPGEAGKEVLRVLGNTGAALITDYADLFLGVGDLIGETFDAVTPGGDGFTADNIFNDADNPWTRWRRNTFAPTTEVGRGVGTLARIATMAVTLPKFAAKGLALPFSTVGRAQFLGPIASASSGIGSFITKADDWMKGVKAGDAANDRAKALKRLQDSFAKGSPAARAVNNAAENTWLALPLDDIAKVTAGADDLKGFNEWASNVRQGVKGLTQLGFKAPPKVKLRTVGQALAWDAFIAFNIAGEGDEEMDATFSDALNDFGLPAYPGLMTWAEDSAWSRKVKQMVEGLAVGAVFNGMIDSYRAYKFAQNFRRAKPTEQAQIMAAFGQNAQEIGDSIGMQIATIDGVPGAVRVGAGDSMVTDERAASIARLQRENADVAARFPQPEPGGALALSNQTQLEQLESTLRQQRFSNEAARRAQMAQQQAAQAIQQNSEIEDEIMAGRMSATLDSPVQQFLAQAEGLASPINPDDARFNQRFPVGSDFVEADPLPRFNFDAMPPVGPAPVAPGGPLVPTAAPSPRFDFGAMPPVDPAAPAPPGAMVSGAVEPVTVRDLGPAAPRGPEPIVTPQTIRSAFERDAMRAWEEMQALTFQQGSDGIFRSLSRGVRNLMPRTRVDAMEYVMRFPTTLNPMGVLPASDSVWTNFISQKALAEGWARVDPDTLEIYYNRKLAFDLDRGDAVTAQAKALDDLESLTEFDDSLVDVSESFRVAQQEQPVPIDPAQSARVADAEVDPAMADAQARAVQGGQANDAYDAWEASQNAQRQADFQQALKAYDEWEGSGWASTAREAIDAADNVDALDAAEEARLLTAERMRMSGESPDQVVVREMLGIDLDSAVNAEVVKADTTRGWNVVDRNGELLTDQKFQTKRRAIDFAKAENNRFKQALVNRARQMEADADDQVMTVNTSSPVMESDLTASIKLTAPQQTAVRGILPEIDEIIIDGISDAAFARGTGWFNRNDPKWSGSIELTQGQMSALSDAIKTALAGDNAVKGTQARVLRNLIDKLDVQVKLLEPQARAQRAVNNLLNDADQFGKHGEFCDPL